jgi:hypothetical protein
MSDLASKLHEALRDSEGLATATDELTEEIALLEREVSELRLGVSESVLIGDDVSSRCPLWFRKEGKTWRFVVVNGANAIPLINASRELRLIAVDFLPELITKLVESSRSRVAHVRDKALTVRALRDSLKTRAPVPNPPTEEEVTAQELTAQYVHNLRVRYDGLLELVRNENEGLHKTLRETNKSYGDLFDLCESVFCGSQGDASRTNPEALNKLMDVVRERAHETGDRE